MIPHKKTEQVKTFFKTIRCSEIINGFSWLSLILWTPPQVLVYYTTTVSLTTIQKRFFENSCCCRSFLVFRLFSNLTVSRLIFRSLLVFCACWFSYHAIYPQRSFIPGWKNWLQVIFFYFIQTSTRWSKREDHSHNLSTLFLIVLLQLAL